MAKVILFRDALSNDVKIIIFKFEFYQCSNEFIIIINFIKLAIKKQYIQA